MRYIRWHYYHLAGSCIYVLAADSEFGLPIQYLYHCIKGSRRLIGERDPYRVNMTAVLEAAERTGTAMEINAHPSRLDLADVYVRKAKELGGQGGHWYGCTFQRWAGSDAFRGNGGTAGLA